MRLHFDIKHIFAGLTALILAGCSLSATPPPTSQDPAPAYTAAAQTIIAQLTQAAQTATVVTPPLERTDTPAAGDQIETPVQTPIYITPTATPVPATSTATAPITASPTSPPSATQPPPSSDPRLYLGNPSIFDSFDSGANWALYEDDHVSFEVDDGQLVMTAFNPDYWDGWMLSWPVISDFYLEMIAAPQTCASLDRYGMMARAQKSDGDYLGYLYGFSCDGRYSLRRWDGSNYVTIVDWTESEFIRKGDDQGNRLGLMADGTKLALYANGVLLEEVSDDIHLSGKFGVYVGSVKTPNFTILVDEIAYWELP
jgi:hypothetical protein